ncbi:Uncharacterized conserved protein (DUF2305) [Geosmithia morbida]|uniref:Uncharacterized conserved protein (DUF2305) n=1 Tax=Geosmithia morbida TaxID=1094350 RepID=A0A9P5D0R7_9HYPO|nr:Uncharacterized conserved protein (DUF2305) [Geosmithia morbida]KAF4121922.1 Uncharacterized conserved protein (DUF2305) [Geosmithia morbida]
MTSHSAIFLPAPEQTSTKATYHALIYFVCGNPGLIDFYDDFLQCVSSLVSGSETSTTAYDVYGRDLFGFSGTGPFEPYDLEEQVEAVYSDVAERRRANGAPYDTVIMAGHSVGAYITVEVFSRHAKHELKEPHLTLRHGVLLFPTLTHIALSPSGKKATAVLGVCPAAIVDNVYWVVGAVLRPLREDMIAGLVRRFMGFTEKAALTAARWIKSPHGLRETIYLGRSELEGICEDVWEDKLWDALGGGKGNRFFLFYGKEDHWVADHARDAIVKEKNGKATVLVDETGELPHAFCTREKSTVSVARQVSAWVKEMEEYL